MDLFPYSESESDESNADTGDAAPLDDPPLAVVAAPAHTSSDEIASSSTIFPTTDDARRSTVSKVLPSASDVLSSVARPAFLDAGKPTATEKRYYGLEFKADCSNLNSSAGAKPLPVPSTASVAYVPVSAEQHEVYSSSASSSSSSSSSFALADQERLSQRARNRQQETRGQATFTLKDGRDMPDLYRPSHGVASDPAEVVRQAARGGRAASGHKRASANLLTDGISNATATRDKKARDTQMRKVTSGQSFEGRTWKSEAEMVMRQQYD